MTRRSSPSWRKPRRSMCRSTCIPTQAVRRDYYDNLPGSFSFTLALSAWGWHADTAIHVLRLALSGALDRHPGLKIIIGHMGEAVPFMLDRIDETTGVHAN